jgi:acetyltransferase-like isoleucine patch superfamily enzyme
VKKKALKILQRIFLFVQRGNKLELSKESSISKDALLIGCIMEGSIYVGPQCNIENCKLNGNIHLSGKNQLSGSNLEGKIILGESSKIINSANISGNIEIGRFSTVNGPNTDIIANLNKVTIGNFTSIARNVSIQESFHDHQRLTSYLFQYNVLKKSVNEDLISKGAIEIENDVWVGTQCVILSGVKIGTGAVIAANSTVTSDIPPYAIAAGSPARVIKYRFSAEKITELIKSKWWEMEIEEIVEFYNEFNMNTPANTKFDAN